MEIGANSDTVSPPSWWFLCRTRLVQIDSGMGGPLIPLVMQELKTGMEYLVPGGKDGEMDDFTALIFDDFMSYELYDIVDHERLPFPLHTFLCI